MYPFSILPLLHLTTCIANDGVVRHPVWRADRFLHWIPVEDPGRHAGPQTEFLPRSAQASKQTLSSHRRQLGSAWTERRPFQASGSRQDGEAQGYWRLFAPALG